MSIANHPTTGDLIAEARVINAASRLTRLGGGAMAPGVIAAMREISTTSVDMRTLQKAAGRRIAELTGAEAAMVTCGAAAGLMLAAAAVITRDDPARIAAMPRTEGLPNRLIMARSHRNMYDVALRTPGTELVEVGIADRYSGAGVRDCEPWEIETAIDERTAAVFYCATPEAEPRLEEVVAVAHAKGVPVIVDAAAQLPPRHNLTRFIAAGADLVAFSGGKAIGGPQASGILCGRADLIEAALLNMMDHDIHPALRDGALPPHGIGRPLKAGKEEIVGLLAALERFVATSDDDDAPRLRRRANRLAKLLRGIEGTKVALGAPDRHGMVSRVELDCGTPDRAIALARALDRGDPRTVVVSNMLTRGIVIFSVDCLASGEDQIIADQVRNYL